MLTLIAPIIFDIEAGPLDLTGFRSVDIQTWQRLSAVPSKNQSPTSLDHLVTSARHAGLHVLDVMALRRGVAIERSVWLFLDYEQAVTFLAGVGGMSVEDLARPGSDINPDRQFVTDLFGPSTDSNEKHVRVTCELLRPVVTTMYQPSLFEIAA